MFLSLIKLAVRFSTKKSKGNSASKRTPAGKRRGLKKWNFQPVSRGNIILRQKGVKWRPGQNVGMGKDMTIFALIDGRVRFTKRMYTLGPKTSRRTFVHVIRDGDDVELYSTKRSHQKSWKALYPLNLDWAKVEESPANIKKALAMMERDQAGREEIGQTKLEWWSKEKLQWLRGELAKDSKQSPK